MSFDWKTPMYPDEHPDHQGQAAANDLPDGGLELIVMPAPGTFASVCRLSRQDRETLRAWLNGEGQ